jgi:hypothetical protein
MNIDGIIAREIKKAIIILVCSLLAILAVVFVLWLK